MIHKRLLARTEGRAPGLMVYGPTGMKKTNAIHTLPPPILALDIGEGGTASLIPWVRRRYDFALRVWDDYTDELRVAAFDALDPEVRKTVVIPPGPLIDVMYFDNLDFNSVTNFISAIADFDYTYYNSLATDSLQEFSVEFQTMAKGKNNEMRAMNEINFSWVFAQEKSMQALRKLRNYREKGVFIYSTASEDISKEYVTSPMAKTKGRDSEQPYSIRGTVDAPGKLANGAPHTPDILCHVRLISGEPTWVTRPEPIAGGAAWWDAKDRFGRLPKYLPPNVANMCRILYGPEIAMEIYGYRSEGLSAAPVVDGDVEPEPVGQNV